MKTRSPRCTAAVGPTRGSPALSRLHRRWFGLLPTATELPNACSPHLSGKSEQLQERTANRMVRRSANPRSRQGAVDVATIAERLHTSPRTVQQMLKAGTIKATLTPAAYRLSKAPFAEYEQTTPK